MTYYVYIFYSEMINQFYIGHAYDLENSLYRHRNSGSNATKSE